MTAVARACLVVVAGAAVGCSRPPEYLPVEGTVTVHGKPAPRVRVKFLAEAGTECPESWGVTDAAGRFRLRTHAGADGVVAGTYRVCVVPPRPPLSGQGPQGAPPQAAGGRPSKEPKGTAGPAAAAPTTIPDVYILPGQTPLRVEVRPGAQTVDLRVP